MADAAGNLLGTTYRGGAQNNGTVFEIAKTGSDYASTPITLFSFIYEEAPSGLIADAAGDLFGTTESVAPGTRGTVFEVPYSGGSYASTPTILASFNGGASPSADLIDAAGDLFGTTGGGGAYSDGTVFELVKDALDLTADDGANVRGPAGSSVFSGTIPRPA